MQAPEPNWAEQVTAIATAVGALGLLGAIGAAVVAGRQVKEARKSREAQTAGDFLRRWDEDALVETRKLVAQFATPEELSDAFRRFIAANANEAYILYRELDYFEQLAALERLGHVDFELIKILIGQSMVERWEIWRPSIEGMGEPSRYPLFEALVAKLERSIDSPDGEGGRFLRTPSRPTGVRGR